MNYRILFCLLAICLLAGIVSADTFLIYGVAGENGVIEHATGGASYAAHRGGAGNSINTAGMLADVYVRLNAADPLSIYAMGRSAWAFNTSTLPDDCTITQVVFSPLVWDKDNKMGSPDYGITGFAPASFTGSLVAGDYDSFGSTEYTSRVPYASFSSYTHYNFTYNTDGKNSINKTGYSYAMIRDSWDLNNSYGGSGGVQLDYTNIRFISSASGFPQSYLAFLEITTTAGGATPPVASFTKSKTLAVFPSTITFTDTSTNTPTSWEWMMGDGRANVTTQNPIYQYYRRGLFKVDMSATNTGGTGVATPQWVWIFGFPWNQQFDPNQNKVLFVSVQDNTFTSSRELTNKERLKVLCQMNGLGRECYGG
jgi:PKD repeat protein